MSPSRQRRFGTNSSDSNTAPPRGAVGDPVLTWLGEEPCAGAGIDIFRWNHYISQMIIFKDLTEMLPLTERKEIFTDTLVTWCRRECRDFPWRHNRTPYSIFVAEILLKRTTSKAASRVFNDFIARYPTIQVLASSDPYDLERLIAPIGLYKQRSAGLQEAAKYIISKFQGFFPSTLEALMSIPHIGKYTAACILSFGMNIPAPTVDSNADRVLKRVFMDELGVNASLNRVTGIAWDLLPSDEHVLFNYGLIDFGALICTYSSCCKRDCPLHKICHYFQLSEQKVEQLSE